MVDVSFEASIIENGAATLAGIKVANLYNYHFKREEDAEDSLRVMNDILNPKGVYVEILKRCGDFYLIYIYRRSMLEKILTEESAKNFLKDYGYLHGFEKNISPNPVDLRGALDRLICRLQEKCEFPHEIGVFLGYPMEDIKGFIENKGRNYICCGLWKVYGDQKSAVKTFCKLNKCSEIYMDVYQKGRKLIDMTVSA